MSPLWFLSSILQGYAEKYIQKEKYKLGKKERKIKQLEGGNSSLDDPDCGDMRINFER